MKFIASAAFALEGVVADELRSLGFSDVTCRNNRVIFTSDIEGAARACVWLRSADRVSLLLDSFKAESFDELFEGVAGMDWPLYLERNSRICVDARCVRSRLMSQRDVQSIGKKAVITSMQRRYRSAVFPENGPAVSILISVADNIATVSVDLCGEGLHKRGYRLHSSEAPLRETLAAALLLLAGYDGTQTLLDPFCGSGTIPIEGAMIARRIAPGRSRNFLAQGYRWCAKEFERQKAAAFDCETTGHEEILCGDIDRAMTEMTAFHAGRAGVADALKVSCADARSWEPYQFCGRLVTNPPYGERILDKQSAFELMHDFSAVVSRLLEQLWSVGVLTPETELEDVFFAKSSSKRRIFNSNIPCVYYRFGENIFK